MIEPVVDVSRWQGDIDAKKMLSAGALGLYIKAGGTDKNNGTSYTDGRFRANANLFATKVPCGYYYFFYPHFDGAKQAEYFCNLVKSVQWNLPPAIDVESNPLNVKQSEVQNQIKAFLDTVEKVLNVQGVIYTRASFWNLAVGNPKWAKDYKLWIARYGETLEHPWDNDPKSALRPLPWTDWWMWQYSADKNGRGPEFGVATPGIDTNKVNMTQEEFHKFANWTDSGDVEEPGEVVTPTPTIEITYPHKGFLRRGYNTLNLRSTPTTSSDNVVGQILRGYNFTVYRELEMQDDQWWLIELPDHTVGWGARRYNGITYLEYADQPG